MSMRFFRRDWQKVSIEKGETYYFNRYYDRGIEFYEQFTRNYRYGQILFEKTPTYYKNPKIPERIRQMNPDIKILFVVCDNIRRTISRYLHMREVQKKARIRSEIGATFDEFSVKLETAVDSLQEKLPNATIDELVARMTKRQVPFSASSSHLDTIISDGFYPVYYKYWARFFGPRQLMLVDGTNIVKNPADEIVKIQKFLNVDVQVDHNYFVYNPEKQFYCLRTRCMKSSKGRSRGMQFNERLHQKLQKLYAPFDAIIKVIFVGL